MRRQSVATVVSPWAAEFDAFGHSIRERALLVTPFIAREPLERMADILGKSPPPQVDILTNLAVDSMLQGTIDLDAIVSFCQRIPLTTVRHLPGLHAKVYVADDHLAIVTSGNLTYSALHRNYEYGIRITDGDMVRKIAQDLQEYGSLGSAVALPELEQVAAIAKTLRAGYEDTVRAARGEVRKEFERQRETVRESLRSIRAQAGESTNSIFARTILYLLKDNSLTTPQINAAIAAIHPDLCDDSIDRVINGVSFGRRWKHMVRNAQLHLRRRGLIQREGRSWSLAAKG